MLAFSARQRRLQQRGLVHVPHRLNVLKEQPIHALPLKDSTQNIRVRLNLLRVCQDSTRQQSKLTSATNVLPGRLVCLRDYSRLKIVAQARTDQQMMKVVTVVCPVLKVPGQRIGD